MRSIVLTCMLWVMPGLAAADYCTDRAEAALAELGSVLTHSADGASAGVAREVLVRVCRDAQGNPDAQGADAAAVAPAGAAVEADDDSTTILGIEIKTAPEGAAGYARARKSP